MTKLYVIISLLVLNACQFEAPSSSKKAGKQAPISHGLHSHDIPVTDESDQILAHTNLSLSEFQQYAQQKQLKTQTLTGSLELEVAEDFDRNIVIETYYLDGPGRRTPLKLLNRDVAERLIGTQVEVSAIEKVVEREVVTYAVVHLPDVAKTHEAPPVTTQKMLVLLINFHDSQPPTQYADGRPILQAATLANYLNTKIFHRYFQDIYAGKVRNIVTRVEDWYTLDRDCTELSYPSNETLIGYVTPQEIKTIVAQRGIDHTQFDNISYINNCPQTGWGVASSTTFSDGHRVTLASTTRAHQGLHYGLPNALIPDYSPDSFMRIFIHERLHNYSVGHANALDCGASQILYPCPNIVTYGNPFDVMGKGVGAYHAPGLALNANYLKTKNIRDENQFLSITQPGIYELHPLLSTQPDNIIGAYIHSEFTEHPVFMLENRDASGLDKALNDIDFRDVVRGLNIYTSLGVSHVAETRAQAPQSPRWLTTFNIIDPKPQASEVMLPIHERIKYDALTPENNFFDPITGIRVKVLAPQKNKSANKTIRFQVEYDEAARECYKTSLEQQIGNLYLKKNLTDQKVPSEAKKLILRPGEEFSLEVKTFLSNEIFCPRDQIQVTVLNAPDIQHLVKPLDNGTGLGHGLGGTNPKLGTGSGNGQSDLSIKRTVDDYQKTHLVGPTFRVPVDDNFDDAEGSYELQIEYKNVRTGITRQSTLSFDVIR